jgi:CheY-like chemotaxis protein
MGPVNHANSSLGSLILVVDDAVDVVDVVNAVLVDAGYHVACAFDGKEAIARAIADIPDAIVLDLALPNLDGFAVIRALRADRRTAAIPVVLYTGHVDGEVDVVAHGLGATVVKKPARAETLLDAIKVALH